MTQMEGRNCLIFRADYIPICTLIFQSIFTKQKSVKPKTFCVFYTSLEE